MNKNLKKVIAVALAVGAFSTVSLATDINVKPAYAASYKAKNGELKSLTIKSSKGKTLDLREENYGKEVELSHDSRDYYVKLTDKSEGIKIKAVGRETDDVVKIFLSEDVDATPIDVNDEISLSKGESTLYIRTYSDNDEFRKAKRAKDYTENCEEVYTIHVRKTEASSNEDTTQDPVYLSSIELSNNKSVDFLKSKTSYDVKVSSDVESLKITATPEDSSSKVWINENEVEEKDNYKEVVDLKKGKNEIKIKVADSKYNVRTYILNITRGSASDTEQDEVYLSKIELDDGDIDLDFDEDKTSYTKTVKNDVKKIKILAEPDYTEYVVTVDDDEVYESDDYETEVSLKEGENIIPIVVKDEVNDLTRKYTLTINREKSEEEKKDTTNTNTNTNTNTSSNTTATNTNATISSNWVKDANGYQYKKDGNIVKNDWVLDEVSKNYYYVKEDGYRLTGWKKWNGTWYLLGSDGIMLTGWQKDKGAWYYLNANGSMKTGWLKDDKDGKWYYLNSDGSMKTGWLSSGSKWYYLNSSSGEMKTGWITDGGKQYYLNSPNGDMVTGTKYINGKNYTFDGSGALK